MTKVHMTQKDSIVDEVERLQQQIAQRAYFLFLEHGGAGTDAWADWLAAEHEIVRRPAIEVREQGGTYAVSASLAGADPQDIEVEITPTELVIASEAARRQAAQDGDVLLSELRSGKVFRAVHFPRPVDMRQATAEYRNGILTVTAPIALESRITRLSGNAA